MLPGSKKKKDKKKLSDDWEEMKKYYDDDWDYAREDTLAKRKIWGTVIVVILILFTLWLL